MGDVLDHMMYAYNVEIPPPPPLPRFLPVPIPLLPLLPIPDPLTTLPPRRSLGVRPTTRSHSTGEKYDCRGKTWFEDHYDVKQKINVPRPFRPPLT